MCTVHVHLERLKTELRIVNKRSRSSVKILKSTPMKLYYTVLYCTERCRVQERNTAFHFGVHHKINTMGQCVA